MQKVDKILIEFKGLRFIADIRNSGKKKQLSTIKDENGNVHTSEEQILNVFATFYEQLYKKQNTTNTTTDNDHPEKHRRDNIPQFTMLELNNALKQAGLKK